MLHIHAKFHNDQPNNKELFGALLDFGVKPKPVPLMHLEGIGYPKSSNFSIMLYCA